MKAWTVALVAIFVSLNAGFAQEPFPKAKFLSRVTVDVIRSKSSKIQGGDWDDKTDRISFKIKLTNGDPNLAFDNVKMELYVFAQSINEKKAYKLLQRVTETVSLAPLKTFEYESEETTTQWDSTFATFGAKYKGWYLFLYSPTGELLMEKSLNSIFDSTAGFPSLKVDKYYNKELKQVKVDS